MDRKQPQGGSRMATQEETLELKNGPCELDFFYSLERGKAVGFRTESGYLIEVVIDGIEAEDSSRKKWNFTGTLCNMFNRHLANSKLKGFFNYAEGRIGWLRISG